MHPLVDAHRQSGGVEPMCEVLRIAPSAYCRHAARLRDPARCSEREKRDATLSEQVLNVWQVNRSVYGADKVWKPMKREQIGVDRCTVEPLMRRLGIQGVRCGKSQRTTRPDPKQPCPLDRVNWQFINERSNPLWVAGRRFRYLRVRPNDCWLAREPYRADRIRARFFETSRVRMSA